MVSPPASSSTSTGSRPNSTEDGQAKAPDHPEKESDQVTLLSGVHEGRTTGTPIGFTVPNGVRAVAIMTTSPTAIARAATSPTMPSMGTVTTAAVAGPAHGKP